MGTSAFRHYCIEVLGVFALLSSVLSPLVRSEEFMKRWTQPNLAKSAFCGILKTQFVSKNRPSNRNALATLTRQGSAQEDLSHWRRRIFKNSYTYKGRLIRVRRWSVKLQHRGERRTIALRACRREAAAEEARRVYQKLIEEGWPAVVPELSRTQAIPGNSASFWKQRLVRRPHHGPATPFAPPNGFSVRIAHEGVAWYFPLSSDDERIAAVRARQIHLTVLRQGWAAACASFSRELAVAVHWSANPLAWTYATIHTQTLPAARASAQQNPSGCTYL